MTYRAARKLYRAFRRYHRQNPEIWESFVQLCFKKIKQGFTNYSADAIMHVVRFELDVDPVSDDGFKICNNHVAFYSRLFAQEYPEHDSFFKYRKSAADQFFGDV